MKKIFMFLLVTAFMASCNSAGNKNETKTEPNIAAIKTIELHVTGMTCEGCENTVMKTVNEINGVTESSASHLKELTVVSFDSTLTSIEEISEAINNTGYTVVGELVKAENQEE